MWLHQAKFDTWLCEDLKHWQNSIDSTWGCDFGGPIQDVWGEIKNVKDLVHIYSRGLLQLYV
jgi:hypothetical protein